MFKQVSRWEQVNRREAFCDMCDRELNYFKGYVELSIPPVIENSTLKEDARQLHFCDAECLKGYVQMPSAFQTPKEEF